MWRGVATRRDGVLCGILFLRVTGRGAYTPSASAALLQVYIMAKWLDGGGRLCLTWNRAFRLAAQAA